MTFNWNANAASQVGSQTPIRFFLAQHSVNCHGPWLVLRQLQRHLPHHAVIFTDVDIAGAEQMHPQIEERNPNHTVPLLIDAAGEAIWESHAIMKRLCDAHREVPALARLYPRSPKIRTWIDEALDWRLSHLYPALSDATYAALGLSFEHRDARLGVIAMRLRLRELYDRWLRGGAMPFVGGEEPCIADYSIVTSLALLGVCPSAPIAPEIVAYIERFERVCPDVAQVRAGLNLRGRVGFDQYVTRRVELNALLTRPGVAFPMAAESFYQVALSACPEPGLYCDRRSVDCLAARALLRLNPIEGVSVRELGELGWTHAVQHPALPPCLLVMPDGATVFGGLSVLRYMCSQEHWRSQLPGLSSGASPPRALPEIALAYAGGTLCRLVNNLLGPQPGVGDPRAAVVGMQIARARTVIERLLAGRRFLDGDAPGLSDLAIAPVLGALAAVRDVRLGQALERYLAAFHESVPRVEPHGEINTRVRSDAGAPAARQHGSTARDGGKGDLARFIETADLEPHHVGAVNHSEHVLIQSPITSLPPRHAAWDELSSRLPWLYSTLRVREAIAELPQLDASPASLPDRYLARASSVLAILAHAYWHSEFDHVPDALPASVLEPWLQVTERLGRSCPTMNYEDLYTYNYVGDPSSVASMRLAVPSTGSHTEQHFYLSTVNITKAGSTLVALAEQADAALRTNDASALASVLGQMAEVIRHMNASFQFLSLRRHDPGFVDPVVWTATVATFAMTFMDKLGYGKAIAPSGNSLPIIHLVDAIIERTTFESVLAHKTMEMQRKDVMAPNHLKLLRVIAALNIRQRVDALDHPMVSRAWNEMIRAYLGNNGFLGMHRKKVYGCILTAAILGRPSTLLDFPLNVSTFLQDTQEVNRLLIVEAKARALDLQGPRGAERIQAKLSPRVLPPRQPIDAEHSTGSIDEMTLCSFNDPGGVCYVALLGKVYDLSAYVASHPGGHHALLLHAGLDGTENFRNVHTDFTDRHPILRRLYVCDTLPATPGDGITKPQALTLLALARQATLLQNTLRLEFESISSHRTLADEKAAFTAQFELCPSPFNLMLMLRVMRKVVFQSIPTLCQRVSELAGANIVWLEREVVQRLRGMVSVPARYRALAPWDANGDVPEVLAVAWRTLRNCRRGMLDALENLKNLAQEQFAGRALVDSKPMVSQGIAELARSLDSVCQVYGPAFNGAHRCRARVDSSVIEEQS